MIDGLVQVGIVVFGVLSLVLIARKNPWGFVHGLIGEFLTIIYTVVNSQFAILALAMIQAFIWGYGIYKWFYLNDKTNL
jgi:nicotinamide riboside transporter PnuC